MGLDIYLISKACKTCGHHKDRFDARYTYNVSPMWYDIFPDDKGMVDIDGMTGKQSLKKLTYAKEILIERKEHFIKMNPPNGFGSYDGFLQFINELIDAAQDNPKSVWESWR